MNRTNLFSTIGAGDVFYEVADELAGTFGRTGLRVFAPDFPAHLTDSRLEELKNEGTPIYYMRGEVSALRSMKRADLNVFILTNSQDCGLLWRVSQVSSNVVILADRIFDQLFAHLGSETSEEAWTKLAANGALVHLSASDCLRDEIRLLPTILPACKSRWYQDRLGERAGDALVNSLGDYSVSTAHIPNVTRKIRELF